jgi:phosphoribosylformylglycinamidine synthase
MTLDGNSVYCRLDPRSGAAIAVAEACRNLACVGAKPLGVTNCLNFGNPEKPEIMWQFKKVVEGMASACRAFSIPVTGGNVSFYNDTEGLSIYPTPVLGIVGLLDDVSLALSPGFKREGDVIVLLGRTRAELGGSEYLRSIHGREKGRPPRLNLAAEKRAQELCLEAISRGLLHSAHDPSEGGLAVCLAECSLLSPSRLGCAVDLEDRMRPDALLFGESQSRILVSLSEDRVSELLKLAEKKKTKASVIGRVRGRKIIIRAAGREIVRLTVDRLYQAWKNALPQAVSIR